MLVNDQPGRYPAAMFRILLVLSGALLGFGHPSNGAESPDVSPEPLAGLRLATFDVDATPPVGSRLAYDSVTNKGELGLRARGVVLWGAEAPIVCAPLTGSVWQWRHECVFECLAQAAELPANGHVHAGASTMNARLRISPPNKS